MRTFATLLFLLVAVFAGCSKAGLATNPEDRVKQIEEIVRQYAPPDKLPQPNRNVQYQGESNGPQGTVRITGEFQQAGQWLEKQAVVSVQWNDQEGKWIITSSVPEFSLTDAEQQRQAAAEQQKQAGSNAPTQSGATIGRSDAPVTVVAFFRFDSSHCADFALETEPRIEAAHVDSGELRIEFRPLAIEGDILLASEAAACAGDQGHYWDYYELLFRNQALGFGDADLKDYASGIGLNTDMFNACLDSGKHREEIVTTTNDASQAGINSVPTFFLGKTSDMTRLSVPYAGQTQIPGALPYDTFANAIEDLLPGTEGATPPVEQVKQWPAPPAMTIDTTKSYTATIRTEKGDIKVELFAADAPNTVNNFVFLAQQGFYNNLPFSFVQSDLYALTGNPSDSENGGPGYDLPKETNSRTFAAGTLGMINGSQFFILLDPSSVATANYVAFGQVTLGMDIVQSLVKGDKVLGIDIQGQ